MRPAIEKAGASVLHRVPARVKLLCALGFVIAVALMPRRPDLLYFFPAALLLAVWPVARMPIRVALRRLLAAEVFILGIALLTLVAPAAAPIFLAAIIKSHLCVFCLLLLTWTTPFHEILQELRRVGLPGVMVSTFALMYRYLPVLIGESRRMQRARASRTFSRRRGPVWGSLAGIIGQLFVRSADRAERIYLAMCARGWK